MKGWSPSGASVARYGDERKANPRSELVGSERGASGSGSNPVRSERNYPERNYFEGAGVKGWLTVVKYWAAARTATGAVTNS